MVMSAVSSVSTPGVLVTMMPRTRAVSRSMLSTPLPKLAISLSCGPAWESSERSIRSVTVGTSTCARLDRLGQLGLAHGLVVDIEARVEQLAHARFDRLGQLARDDDERFLGDVGMAARALSGWREAGRRRSACHRHGLRPV